MAEISKTVDHALQLLLLLSDEEALSPAELSRRSGLNRTVVHRLLATLHRRGFVTRTDRGYAPGAVLVRMADQVRPTLRSAARQVMHGCADAIGETVVMHTPDGDDAVVLDQAVGMANLVRVEHRVGSRHPLYGGASGRALLAFLHPAAVERIAAAHPDPATLRRALEGVRQLGYAISHDELQNGVHGLAVPVLDGDGRAIASLAVLVPATRAGDVARHLDRLLGAAADVAARLQLNAAAGFDAGVAAAAG